MAKKAKCGEACDCAPVVEGWYWATHRSYGWRRVVLVDKDGFGHVRVHVARMSRSFDLTEFTDYIGPLTERRKGTAK